MKRCIALVLATTACSDLLGLDDYKEQAAAATTGPGGSGSGGESLGGGGAVGGSAPVQCNGELLLRDAFERRVPEGWGMPDVGMVWDTNGTTSTTVADGSGLMHVVNSEGRAAIAINAVSDVEMVGTIRWAIPGSSFTQVLGGLLLRATFSAYITASIIHEEGQQPDLEITYVTSSGVAYLLGTATLPGSWPAAGFVVRFQVSGANPAALRARAWPRDEEEPATWHLELTNSDGELPQSAGYGAQAYTENNAAGVTVYFDDFSVCEI